MEIRNFVTFKKISETKSFTKAAVLLGYAQSTLTNHIDQIESHYGSRVFERLGRQLILTPLGERLYEESTELIKVYERILHLNDAVSFQGPLRIGAEESIALYKLKGLFLNYRALYPDLEIVLVNEPYSELKKMLLDGAIDIIYIIDKMVTDSNLVSYVISDEKMVFVYSPEYRLKRKEQVIEKPRVVLTRKGGTYREILQAYLSQKKISHEIVMEAGSVELVKQNLILGMGVSYLPLVSVIKEVEEGSLIYEEVPVDLTNRVYAQMVIHQNKIITEPLAALMNLTKATI
jgi:DNA-binding transcriptional LysR family regulator